MSLDAHRQDWDELAESDALWAVLSSPDKQHGRWDLDEFFATGPPEMERVMARAGELGHPDRREVALDFGCGVGRVTRAMTAYFDRCIGVDVSGVMIDSARRLNAELDGVEFVHNDRPDIGFLEDRSIDLVYCYIVLQHLPSTEMIEGYIREFVRVLRPGGLLMFQLPETMPLRRRLQPRRRMYSMLRRVGVPAAIVSGRLGLHPIRMLSLSEARVRTVLDEEGGRLLAAEARLDDDAIPNRIYWVTR